MRPGIEPTIEELFDKTSYKAFATVKGFTAARLCGRAISQTCWYLDSLEVGSSVPMSSSLVATLIRGKWQSYATKSYRGLGLSKRLLEKFMKFCDEAGATEIIGSIMPHDLQTTSYLPNVYIRRGFKIVAPDQRCLDGAAFMIQRKVS